MHIGLIDVDGHNFPNLALMKISSWHKSKGDTVEWWWGWGEYDRVYMSKVFDDTYYPDVPEPYNTKEVIKGGTGFGLDNQLPYEVEHMYPDYGLYPNLTQDTAYGFLTRGCPRGCHFCIVADKEGRKSVKVADLSEWWRGQKYIKLLDPNLLACKDHISLLEQLVNSKAYVDFTQGLDCRLHDEFCEIMGTVVSALRPITREQVEKVWEGECDCSNPKACCTCCSMRCQYCIGQSEYKQATFCMKCGRPLTNKAVNMVMERLEAVKGEA